MYKELVSDIEGFQHPGHGDLTGWAQQGFFFKDILNVCMAAELSVHNRPAIL